MYSVHKLSILHSARVPGARRAWVCSGPWRHGCAMANAATEMTATTFARTMAVNLGPCTVTPVT